MKALPIFVGAAVGTLAAPMVLNALNIPVADGFGMDDLAQAAIIAASIILVDMVM